MFGFLKEQASFLAKLPLCGSMPFARRCLIVDIRKLLEDLKEAKQQHDEVFLTQRKVEKSLIKEEAELLKQFTAQLFAVGETKEIHADDALLIYKYKVRDKTAISPDVYLSSDFKIKYEVYDEEQYLRFRPMAWIVDGWNIMEPEEFLLYLPLEKIFEFFNERAGGVGS